MDTSEQYTKMCDCEEIQKGWNPAGHDFVKNIPEVNCKNYGHGNYFWLPRQDQLQEMVGGFDGFENFQQVFCFPWEGEFGIPNYMSLCTSMEQLWLAFVMSEKYDKIWDGINWK